MQLWLRLEVDQSTKAVVEWLEVCKCYYSIKRL